MQSGKVDDFYYKRIAEVVGSPNSGRVNSCNRVSVLRLGNQYLLRDLEIKVKVVKYP